MIWWATYRRFGDFLFNEILISDCFQSIRTRCIDCSVAFNDFQSSTPFILHVKTYDEMWIFVGTCTYAFTYTKMNWFECRNLSQAKVKIIKIQIYFRFVQSLWLWIEFDFYHVFLLSFARLRKVFCLCFSLLVAKVKCIKSYSKVPLREVTTDISISMCIYVIGNNNTV